MRIESLLSIEEIRTTVATAYGGNQEGNPSKQLHEDEEEDAKWEAVSSHLWFATADISGTPLDPRLVTKARQEEMRYFKEM